MSVPIQASALIAFHDRSLSSPNWPSEGAGGDQSTHADVEPWHWVMANHRFNGLLWAEEDLARRTLASDTDIAANRPLPWWRHILRRASLPRHRVQ
jgi:hypothetical protein